MPQPASSTFVRSHRRSASTPAYHRSNFLLCSLFSPGVLRLGLILNRSLILLSPPRDVNVSSLSYHLFVVFVCLRTLRIMRLIPERPETPLYLLSSPKDFGNQSFTVLVLGHLAETFQWTTQHGVAASPVTLLGC
jgi:hypothetical protein